MLSERHRRCLLSPPVLFRHPHSGAARDYISPANWTLAWTGSDGAHSPRWQEEPDGDKTSCPWQRSGKAVAPWQRPGKTLPVLAV
ncbi:hypothetical protein GN956_G19627 [Arapaima gigas]